MSARKVPAVPPVPANGNGNGGHDIVPAPDPAVGFIAALAANPDIDSAKLRQMWDIQREVIAEKAKVQFAEAMAKAQAEFPVIGRDAPNEQTKSRYARFETIWEMCAPFWTRHGLTVTFDAVTTPEGMIRVTCLVRCGAHVEKYTAPDTPPDNAGAKGTVNKTMVQANQSTVTYVKRGLLCSSMGIVTRYEDDDGNSSRKREEHERMMREAAEQAERDRREAAEQARRERERQLSPWVVDALDRLASVEAEPGRWFQWLIAAFAKAPSVGDLSALVSETARTLATAPAAKNAEAQAAIAAAYDRFAAATEHAEQTANESGTPDSQPESPVTPFGYAPVMPPLNNGKPAWPVWYNLLRDDLASVPPDSLTAWAETQRAQFDLAMVSIREKARVMILEAFGRADVGAPPDWLAAAPPPDKDAAYVADRIAELAGVPDTIEGRRAYDRLYAGAAYRTMIDRLKRERPELHAQWGEAVMAKEQTLPRAPGTAGPL